MNESSSEFLTKSKLNVLRKEWSKPDSKKEGTWEYDGFYGEYYDYVMGYNHEMREGLGIFECKTFDALVDVLNKKLDRKPNVIDLMGGAYFLDNPGNTNSLVGIRIHDKDEYIGSFYKSADGGRARVIKRVMTAPNRRVIEADILSNKGWKTIEKAGIPKADLLVCRPVGPLTFTQAMGNRFDEPRTYAGLYSSLFRRMLGLVNKHGGVIFTEAPAIYSGEEIKDFFTGVDEKEGSRTNIFKVPENIYYWGGENRRYAVIQFKK